MTYRDVIGGDIEREYRRKMNINEQSHIIYRRMGRKDEIVGCLMKQSGPTVPNSSGLPGRLKEMCMLLSPKEGIRSSFPTLTPARSDPSPPQPKRQQQTVKLNEEVVAKDYPCFLPPTRLPPQPKAGNSADV